MAKVFESVSKYELLLGLGELERQGELSVQKQAVLSEVVIQTKTAYAARNSSIQPKNATLAVTEGQSKCVSNVSSNKLRVNMLMAGRAVPIGTETFHVVTPEVDTGKSQKDYATGARAILARWGIPLNHEANGVALATSKCLSSGEALRVYYLDIAAELDQSKSRSECIRILREIGQGLKVTKAALNR